MNLYFTPNTRKDSIKMSSIVEVRKSAVWDKTLESFVFSGKDFDKMKKDLTPKMQGIKGAWEIV